MKDIIIVVFGIFLVILISIATYRVTNNNVDECKSKGGVTVQTSDGWRCAKLTLIQKD
jgi:uncharacterized protein YpmB